MKEFDFDKFYEWLIAEIEVCETAMDYNTQEHDDDSWRYWFGRKTGYENVLHYLGL